MQAGARDRWVGKRRRSSRWVAGFSAGLVGIALLATGAGPAGAGGGVMIPPGNLIANPSFELNMNGWAPVGAEISRVPRSDAPLGGYVALVDKEPGVSNYRIRDDPATVGSSVAGTGYRADAWVRRAASEADGKQIALYVRERTPAGVTIGQAYTKIPLSNQFEPLSTTYVAQGDGNLIDTHLRRPPTSSGTLVSGEMFYADAYSLTQGAPQSLVWSDEFSGPAGSTPNLANWGYEDGYEFGLSCFTAGTQYAHLDGTGQLALIAREEACAAPSGSPCQGTCDYRSGAVNTFGKVSFQSGQTKRFEGRIKLPAGKGFWPAFWLLADDWNGPAWRPEIDFLEYYGWDPSYVWGAVHGPPAQNSVGRSSNRGIALPDGYHVYGGIWEPGRITFTIDGSTWGSITAEQFEASGGTWELDDTSMYLILDLAMGSGDGSGNTPDETTPIPATMYVDWIRVWQ